MAEPKQLKAIKGIANVGKKLLAEPAPAYTSKILESTTAKFADKIADANPKLSDAEVQKKALAQATKKLEWERVQKPALEKKYGPLAKASFAESNPNKMQNTAEVVAERKRKANEFLDQPTEPWTPPRKELQAFDRNAIKDALEGFPDVEQSRFPRDKPARASTSHVEELYADPENRALIEKQIKRGLPLGGETFYASLYPVKRAVMEAGMPAEKFDQWIHSLAPASARNSIMNEMAVGQFLRNMNARGIPLTEENVAKEMAAYKEKFGIGLPLMPIHRQGVQNVIEGGANLREQNLANIPTNYKIPTYGTQKAGDFAKSAVLDVHEAGGHTQGSRFHPYFNEQGGFGNTEYGKGEEGLLSIAEDLGIPGGMAQAGRWFGGGELTGLKSPRGDALDLLEKQVAFTLKQKGIQPNPANVRSEVLRQIETGEGDLLPWYRKEGMPDVRETGLQRAEGGEVDGPSLEERLTKAIGNHMAGGGVVDSMESRLTNAISTHMASGGGAFKKLEFMDKGGKVGKIAKAIASVGKRLMADPEKKVIEAPSIITPSKVSNVKEAVRQSKGDYGARRVERAADEIPNLENLYQENALKEAFIGDNARALMTMNPKDFEKYASPISPRMSKPQQYRGYGSQFLDDSMKDMTLSEYIDNLSGVKGGFADVPYLLINKQEQGLPLTPFITGHEGRHRSRSLANKGEQGSLVQLLPRAELREPLPRRTQEEYIEALKKELEMTGNKVIPQRYQDSDAKSSSNIFAPNKDIIRPAVDLPDIYAEGGPAFKKLEFMADGGKAGKFGKLAEGVASVGKKLLDSGEAAPKVDRLSMSYKDVTKRVPEVAEAIEKLNRGEITRAQYNDIVNLYKPVTPYSFVPKPATKEEAIDALRGDAAKSRYGAQAEYTPGSKVGLRLDIPAYTGKGVWVNSIHDETAKKVAYGPVASVKNANLSISQNESKRIALGGAKAPYAKIKGEWNPMSEEEAVAKAQEYLNHPEWRQIGMDPERHSYFYDRHTMAPITGAEEVIQIGPLVLGKNPKYGKMEDFEYAKGGYATMLPFADGGKIIKGGLNIARRLFKTTDGYTFKEMPDGRVTNGDMTWNSVKEFQQEMPHAYQQGDQLGQRRASMESYGSPSGEQFMKELSGFMREPTSDQFYQQAINKQNAPKPKLSVVPPEKKAEGGGAFKKLSFYDKGGVTTSAGSFSPEELGVTTNDLRVIDDKTWELMKKNAPATYEWAKQNVKDEASQLKSARGAKDFALRVGAQYAGALPDLINLGLMLPDAVAGTKLASEKPWFGSAQIIDAMEKAGMLGESEFPIAETVAGIAAPAGLIRKGVKKGYQAYKGMKPEAPKKRRGGLAAMSR